MENEGEEFLNLVEVFRLLKRWRDEKIEELDVPYDKYAS